LVNIWRPTALLDWAADTAARLIENRGTRFKRLSQRRCARDWDVALGDVCFEADCGLKPDIAPSQKSANKRHRLGMKEAAN